MAGNGTRPVMSRLQVILLCAATCALVQVVARAGDQRSITPSAPPEYLARVSPVTFSDQTRLETRSIYDRECRKCHGADGKGRGSATRGMSIKPPDFTDQKFMSTRADGQFFWIILNGSDPDTTEMAGFKKKLSEDDAWKLVHLIREFARSSQATSPSQHQLVGDNSNKGATSDSP